MISDKLYKVVKTTLLLFAVFLILIPGWSVLAEEEIETSSVIRRSGFSINPLWEGVITEDDYPFMESHHSSTEQKAYAKSSQLNASSIALDHYSDVASSVGRGLSSRQNEIRVSFIIPEQEITEPEAQDLGIVSTALNEMDPYQASMAMAYHTGVTYYVSDGMYHGDIVVNDISYWTTDAQESEFEARLKDVINELNLDGVDDYNKASIIYKYITENVTYDYGNSSKLIYTAYGALNNGKAVCQGYALLFYKMAREAGLDAQYLHGISSVDGNQELHAWNGVKINGRYYLVDSTWDSINIQAGSEEYYYFLKGTESFVENHIPDADYNTLYSKADFASESSHSELPSCREFGFLQVNGKWYWFEDWKRQGIAGDPKNIIDDTYGHERGREIYDPESNGWYWLDSVYDGAKAEDKEVWMPYIYQNEAEWSPEEIQMNANASGVLSAQVCEAIKNRSGKWVRYDADGKMYKGWYTVEGREASIYPQQAGNTYYYDLKTGLMAKGAVVIDGNKYYFDEITGALVR